MPTSSRPYLAPRRRSRSCSRTPHCGSTGCGSSRAPRSTGACSSDPRVPRRLDSSGMAGFLLGAAGMFAVTYSTQAILPQLGRTFHVSPAEAGLSISIVVLALACGSWLWGPLSDRYGRKRSIVLASALLVAPTIGAALAPSFAFLLAFRALQGLCMPGLLTAGVPYITEVYAPRIGGRAMGYYVTALVAGGLIGRVGVALLAAAFGWRVAIGLLAVLPLAAVFVMQ